MINMIKLNKNKGFTLVEMLVVMTIVAILLAISLVSYAGSRKMARDSKRKADIESVRSALEVYRTDCHTYPATLSFDGTAQIRGSEAECLNNVYLEDTPADPLSPTYSYFYEKDSDSANIYRICAFLEAPGNTTSCTNDGCGSVNCNYEVTNP